MTDNLSAWGGVESFCNLPTTRLVEADHACIFPDQRKRSDGGDQVPGTKQAKVEGVSSSCDFGKAVLADHKVSAATNNEGLRILRHTNEVILDT